MSQQATQEKPKSQARPVIIGVLAGIVVGAVLGGAAIVSAMPRMMILTQESRLGFDETVAALEGAIAEEGWVVSTVTDMNASMAKHGVDFGPRVKLVKLCQPEYAQSILTTDRHIATMMPCSFAVWEGDDGGVYVSKMNMGLMAKMFGGNVAKVMGSSVASDEHAMLADIVKN